MFSYLLFFFFFTATATPEIYTLSLHDALPICGGRSSSRSSRASRRRTAMTISAGDSPLSAGHSSISASSTNGRSEEHTSELQSRFDLVCRLLLEKKKNKTMVNKIVKIAYRTT